MNGSDSTLDKLKINLQSFKLGIRLDTAENMQLEFKNEILPVALAAFKENLKPEQKSIRKEINNSMKILFKQHKSLIDAATVITYFVSLENFIGSEKAFRQMIACFLERDDSKTAHEFCSENTGLAKKIFWSLIAKTPEENKTLLDFLYQYVSPLDPSKVTLQQWRLLQSAGFAINDVRLIKYAIKQKSLELIELIAEEDLEVEELVEFLLLKMPGEDEFLRKMRETLLFDQERMTEVIAYLIDLISLDSEEDQQELIALLNAIVKAGPMIDSYALGTHQIGFLHRSGYFMAMPRLFSALPLADAAARADVPRVLDLLEIEGNMEGLKLLAPELIGPLFEAVIRAGLMEEDDRLPFLARELAALKPQLDLTKFPRELLVRIITLLIHYRIPLNSEYLFRQSLLQIACEEPVLEHVLLRFAECQYLPWELVQLEQRQYIALTLLEKFEMIKAQIGDSKELLELWNTVLRSVMLSGLNLNPRQLNQEHFMHILNASLPINPKGAFELSPFLDAINAANEQRIEFFIKSGANISDLWQGSRGFYPSVVSYVREKVHTKTKTYGEQSLMVFRYFHSKGLVIDPNAEFEDSLLARALNDSNGETVAFKKFIGYLLKNGFSLDSRNQAGQTVMLWAIGQGMLYWTIVLRCLELSCSLSICDNEGHGPIYYALKSDLPASNLWHLIESGAQDFTASYNGKTVLHVFWKAKNFVAVEQFIAEGADVNIRFEETGESLLISAIRQKQTELTQLILSKNPDLKVKDKTGRDAFAAAFDYECMIAMLQILEKETVAFDWKKVDPPLEAISDKPRVITGGESLLTWAAMTQGAEVSFIEKLLAKGASIDLVNNRGETLLHYAVRTKNRMLFDYCLAKGANVNIKNSDGDSPLMYSLLLGDEESSLRLLDKGAALYEKNEYGIAPIAVVGKIPVLSQEEKRPDGTCVQVHLPVYYSKYLESKNWQKAATPAVFRLLLNKHPLGQQFSEKSKYDLLLELDCLAFSIDSNEELKQIVELSLLLDFSSPIFTIANKLGAENFAKLFVSSILPWQQTMPKKYWLNHLLIANGKHLEAPLTQNVNGAYAPSQPVGAVDLKLLLAFFDAINVTDPTKKDDYFDPKTLLKGTFLRRQAELRANLNELIMDVINKKSKRKFENPEEDFKTLRRLLGDLVLQCQKLQDPRQRTLLVLDIAKEASNCSVGWMLTANSLKALLDFQLNGDIKFKTLEETILHELMLLRTGKIELLSGGNVHGRNQWLQAIGPQLNIPEAQSLGTLKDGYGYKSLDEKTCMLKFLMAYSPAELCILATKKITETLKRERQQSEHSTVLHYFETHVPPDYRREYYEAIRIEVKQSQASWQEIFTSKCLAFNPKCQSMDEALERARREDYIYSGVFSHYSEIPELAAVASLLIDIGAVKEIAPGVIFQVSKLLKAKMRKDKKRKF